MTPPGDPRWIDVIEENAIRVGRCEVVQLGTDRVLLAHTSTGLFATQVRCTHARVDLGPGRLNDGLIECPMHGALFDPETGDVLSGPAQEPIETFPVDVVDGIVRVLCSLAQEHDVDA